MMMHRRSLVASAALMLCVGGVAGAQVRTLTLGETLRLADEQSLDVRKAQAVLERSTRSVETARSLFLPELAAAGDYAYNIQRQVFFVAPGTPLNPSESVQAFAIGSRHSATLGLSVTQPLYDPIRRMQRLVAEAGVLVSRAQLDAARALVRMNAERAFYQALYARSESAARDEQIKAALSNYDVTLARFRQGRAMALDTLTATVSVARARASAERARFTYQRSMLTLAQALDLPDYENIDLQGALDVPSEAGPSGGDPLMGRAVPNSAQQKLAEAQRDAAQTTARLEGYTLAPVVNAVARWQALGQSNSQLPDDARWATTSQVGISAQLPISGLWRNDGRRDEALMRVREAELEIERIRKEDTMQLQRLQLAMRGARAQLVAEQAGTEQARRAVEITMILYKEGRATLLDVENAQSRVVDARLAENRARLEFLDAYAEMKAIVGTE